MINKSRTKDAVKVRHIRLRKKISGTAERPRLAVFKSLNHISVQIIDDVAGKTLAAAGTVEKEIKKTVKYGGNIDAAKVIGKEIAERAKKAGIESVVFDRGGNLYHGRVAALAEAAREAGLNF